MSTTVGDPVDYALRLDELEIPLNPLIGRELKLEFTGTINCTSCNRRLKKTYQQGYCYPCTQVLAECDLCIVRPDRCHYDRGDLPRAGLGPGLLYETALRLSGQFLRGQGWDHP